MLDWFSVAYMYDFKNDCFLLDNHLEGSSLGEANSPSLQSSVVSRRHILTEDLRAPITY